MRILTTLLRPDGGSASVAGFDVVREGARVREQIGLAGQYAAVDENLTGFENLEMVGRLYHLGRRASRERARELLASFELAEAGDRLVSTYSGGMRRRLDLAAALVARPPVLFLDEPTTGLDLPSRIGLWEAIEGLAAEGTTVLLTTQYLRRGRPPHRPDRGARRRRADRRGDAGRAEGAGRRRPARGAARRREQARRRGRGAGGDGGRARRSLEDGSLRVPVRHRKGAIAEAVRRLDDAGIGIDDIALRSPTLDDVFLDADRARARSHDAEPEAGG